MSNVTPKASLSATMMKIYSISALLLVLVATVTLILKFNQPSNLNEQSSQQSNDLQLSALALEGKDVFIKQGCLHCHSEQAQNASLVLAGALFAPQFPFRNQMMDQLQLRYYLSGETQTEGDSNSVLDASLSKNESTDEEPHEYILHSPQFESLSSEIITGSHTQAKMLLDSQSKYTRESLVQASQMTAGVSKLDALLTYLQETSVRNMTEDASQL
jgi:cbb3-type cytochrome oxidase cytochrome c subunit